MGFVWTTITPGTTEADADHMNEVKDAADWLATNLGIALYGWVNYPISADEIISAVPHVSELRDALDYADDNNVCAAENATYYTAVRNTYYASNNGADNPLNVIGDFGDYQIGAHGCG